MKNNDILEILKNGSIPDSVEEISYEETPFSWIIFGDHKAFKIKKPVDFPFLDFSNKENRKQLCEKEMKLNAELNPGIYEDVIPVIKTGEQKGLDIEGETADYAIVMKKLDNEKRMDHLIQDNKLGEEPLKELARKLAAFHINAQVSKDAFDSRLFQEDFKAIEAHKQEIQHKFGVETRKMVDKCIEKSIEFLKNNVYYLQERTMKGFRRDIHGDLAFHNIFFEDKPIIIGRVEFDDMKRQIDLLNDIASLMVDFDFYKENTLGDVFLDIYKKEALLDSTSDSEALMTYYKLYRSNKRIQKILFAARNMEDLAEVDRLVSKVERYLQLMKIYLNDL